MGTDSWTPAGQVVLPRSSNAGRIAENFDVFDFELSDEEVKEIDALDEGVHYCWNPETVQ